MKLKTSILYYALPISTESKSSGILEVTSRSTSIIEQYISKALALWKLKKPSPLSLGNLRKKNQTAKDQTMKPSKKCILQGRIVSNEIK